MLILVNFCYYYVTVSAVRKDETQVGANAPTPPYGGGLAPPTPPLMVGASAPTPP